MSMIVVERVGTERSIQNENAFCLSPSSRHQSFVARLGKVGQGWARLGKARMPRMPRSPKATADDFHVYSGEREMRSIRELGTWPDGAPVGRGFPQPCLQDRYAAAIIEGRKTFEGRPGGGWLTSRGDMIRPGDYVNFQISQRRRLIVRVLSVHFFRTFEEMLNDIGVQNLLPDEELRRATRGRPRWPSTPSQYRPSGSARAPG